MSAKPTLPAPTGIKTTAGPVPRDRRVSAAPAMRRRRLIAAPAPRRRGVAAASRPAIEAFVRRTRCKPAAIGRNAVVHLNILNIGTQPGLATPASPGMTDRHGAVE